MWLLKLPLDQNPRVIYLKFNGDLRATSILRGQKEDKGICVALLLIYDFFLAQNLVRTVSNISMVNNFLPITIF
jgi:hypothetical protein